MTTPAERRRALRWARSTFENICNDPGASAEVKAGTAAVLAAFPDELRLGITNIGAACARLARSATKAGSVLSLRQFDTQQWP